MQEDIILEGMCNRIKGAFAENGHAMLTNQRFVYSKYSLVKLAVVGILLNNFMMNSLMNHTKGDFDFDIPLVDIIGIEERKRLFHKILIIKTTETEYKFFFTKLECWESALNNVIRQNIVYNNI